LGGLVSSFAGEAGTFEESILVHQYCLMWGGIVTFGFSCSSSSSSSPFSSFFSFLLEVLLTSPFCGAAGSKEDLSDKRK